MDRMDVDLPMQTFINKHLYEFKIKQYMSGKAVPRVKPGTGRFTTYR